MVYQMWALVYCMLEDNQCIRLHVLFFTINKKLFWKYFKVHIHHMRYWKSVDLL
jgi:hypothetical protein